MFVVADNIGRSCCNGTIHEFVVVGVCGDEVETIGGRYALHIGRLDDFLNDSVGNQGIISQGENLVIFKEYLVRHAQFVSLVTESQPDIVVVRFRHDYVYKAVGVEDNLHR